MKNFVYIVFVIITLTLIASCQSNKQQTLPEIRTGNIHKNGVNYSYLIKNSSKQNDIPLLLVIDPHGSGEYAIKKFNNILKNHNGIIIGLNNVRNNASNYETSIYKAINDAIQNFPVDRNKIYLAGFSGGARMVFQYAINYGCSGLIMCGAGPTNTNNITIPFPLVMITGTRDFNFVEQYYSPYSETAKNTNLIALHFKGNHEWPSENILSQAYYFICNDSRNNANELKTCLANSKQLETENKYLLSFKQLELASKISTSPEKEKIELLINELISKKEFKNYIDNFEQNLNNEILRNKNYVQALELKDKDWWQKELNQILEFSKDTNETIESDSYARTKAFLGVFLFSKLNQLMHQNEHGNILNKTLFVYEQLEPSNPDVFYYKSLYAYFNQDTLNSLKNMEKAIDLGFSDNFRLQKDFPDEFLKLLHKNQQ